MSARPLVTAAALAPRGAYVEPRDVSLMENRRGVVVQGDPDRPPASPRWNGAADPSEVKPPTPLPKEPTMPKGQYDRSKAKPRAAKKKTASEPTPAAAPAGEQLEAPTSRKKRGPNKKRMAREVSTAPKPQRRRASSSSIARTFAVWNDGSVEINADGCKGHLSGQDVDLLVAYVQMLRKGDRS
jgi:hypothetical protein